MDSEDMDDMKVLKRIATALEKIADTNVQVLSTGYALSPGPYCCGCGTHLDYSKEKGYHCNKCDFYDKEEY